jgi:RNA recognition motif-containing protein
VPNYLARKEKEMNIYVGNLPNDVTDDDLRQAFGAFGDVASVNIIKDRFSGESRGFGFVEMANKSEAEAAIAGVNGQEIKGKSVKVNEARPKTDSPRPSGGRGGGGGRDRGDRRGGGGGGGGGGRGGRGGGDRGRY